MSIQAGLKRWIFVGAVLLAAAGTTIAGIQGTGFRAFATIGTVETGSGGGVSVNGVPYDTSHAHVTINGRAGDVTQLRDGHIVAVHGSPAVGRGSAAIADEIVLESDVRGQVTSVDESRAVFSVLGQTIQLTAESVLDPLLVANGLTMGTWVKVSAFERSDGSFVASRVDIDLAPGESQVRGVVQSLDRSSQTLRIGKLTVDYSAASKRGPIAVGAVVLARGVQVQAGGSLAASSVDASAGVGRPGERGDIEGIITTFGSRADFEINGQPVVANDRTVYVLHGQTLGSDVEVRVTGRFDARGILIAQKIQMDALNKR